MNDQERENWINNDEGLYNWRRSWRGKGGTRGFIRAHRTEIDAAIGNVTSGRKPAHYLAYPGRR